jgi:hypothetical protein
LWNHEISDRKLVVCWGNLALRPEEKSRLLQEAWVAEAECKPDRHPAATAIAECLRRFETGDCPSVSDSP